VRCDGGADHRVPDIAELACGLVTVTARSTKKRRPIRLSVSSRRLMVLTLGLGVLPRL